MTHGLWPLFEEFPRLAELPRVALRRAVTPIEPLEAPGSHLWVKRDDLTALPIGGNKVRALEFLLGPLRRGDHLLTAGARGSTHALTTAMHAATLGATTTVAWWPQEMNDTATVVSARLDELTERREFANALFAVAWLEWRRLRGDRVIPAGGTSPLGILGHVNAAFELAAQIRSGALPKPGRVVAPLGTGGTVAGLTLGFELAGVATTVVGARVVPKIVGRASRVRRLMRRTRALLERVSGRPAAGKARVDLAIDDSVYGGGYARPLSFGGEILERLPSRLRVDPTYSAKALVAAASGPAGGETLFWLTFDSRWITSGKTGRS